MSETYTNRYEGWVLGTVVKTVRGVPTFHIRVLWFESWICFPFYISVNAYSWRQKVMAQLVESLTCPWEMRMEFLATGFGLTQPLPLQSLRE